MSTDMSGLTAAWLGAVLQAQKPPTLVPERLSDQSVTLTNVIEGALRSGGLDSKDPNWVDPLAPGQLVDRQV